MPQTQHQTAKKTAISVFLKICLMAERYDTDAQKKVRCKKKLRIIADGRQNATTVINLL
jgi:hypothetical protein